MKFLPIGVRVTLQNSGSLAITVSFRPKLLSIAYYTEKKTYDLSYTYKHGSIMLCKKINKKKITIVLDIALLMDTEWIKMATNG